MSKSVTGRTQLNIGNINLNNIVADTLEATSSIKGDYLTASKGLATNADKQIVSTTASSAEIDLLAGATSNIQTQLTTNATAITANANAITTANTNIATNTTNISANATAIAGKEPTVSLTANRALISNGSGGLAVSDITNTELGFLDGASSNIQTQLTANANDIITANNNITTNTNNIATANTNIATNTNNISTANTNITTNATAIATANTAITTNATAIAGAIASIATNATAIGTKQDALTFGVSNGNVLKCGANVADDDFLKIDGSVIEGRTSAELLSDILQVGTGVSFDATTTPTTLNSVWTLNGNHIFYNSDEAVDKRVGVGTNSPSHILHLKSDIDATLFIEADADNTDESHLPMLLLSQDNGIFHHSFGGKQTDPTNALKIETGRTDGTSSSMSSIVFLLNGTAGENSGTERMRIEPDGKVGIGTQSPDGLLHLKSSGDVLLKLEADHENIGEFDLPQLLLTQDGGLHFHSFSGVASSSGHNNDNSLRIETGADSGGTNSGSICFATGGTSGFGSGAERMRIDEAGKVGIGTTAPSQQLEVIGNQMIRHGTTNSRGYVELKFNNNGLNQGSGGGLLLASNAINGGFAPEAIIDTWRSGVSGNAPILIKTRGTERMRIEDGGNVGIGDTSPDYPLSVGIGATTNISGAFSFLRLGSGTEAFVAQDSAGQYNTVFSTDAERQISIRTARNILSEGAFVSVCDRRIKKNIQDVEDDECLTILRQIKPKKYQYISEYEKGYSTYYGYIAQEVKEHLPNAVVEGSGYIPNVYQMCPYQNDIIEINTSLLDVSSSCLKLLNEYAEYCCAEYEIVDDSSIKIVKLQNLQTDQTELADQMETFFNKDSDGNSRGNTNLFVFGNKVNDFNSLAKEDINVVAVGAIQQLDLKIDALTKRLDALENRLP